MSGEAALTKGQDDQGGETLRCEASEAKPRRIGLKQDDPSPEPCGGRATRRTTVQPSPELQPDVGVEQTPPPVSRPGKAAERIKPRANPRCEEAVREATTKIVGSLERPQCTAERLRRPTGPLRKSRRSPTPEAPRSAVS